jgi:hypothetical protein
MLDARTCSRFLRSFCLGFAALLTFSSAVMAQTPTVMWNANPEADLAGYVVQYGTQAGNPSTSVDVGNVTSRQVTGLTAGATYYFRVIAYNASGLQSGPSTEASYAVPGTPPPPPPAPAPTLTSVTPASGALAGGTQLTLTGSNFVAGATVRVGGVAATGVTLTSATQLRATTPAGTAGARAVQVTNPDGQSVTLNNAFTYVATAPTLTSVTPGYGPLAGGTQLTLTGSNFVSGATVRVGGIAATGVTFTSATQLRANTPAGTAGAKAVEVTNPDGQSVTLNNAFTYGASAPTLTSVTPGYGPLAGGTQLTLTGSNFVSGATVRVGGVAATGVTFTSATQLRANTPAGTVGAKAVQVTNPDGQSVTLNNAFTYGATAPTLTTVTPGSGPLAGGTQLTLTGSNFVSGATVRVGGVAATGVTFTSATQLRATTPAGTAGLKAVQVTNPDGQSVTLNNAFTYTSTTTSAPTVTSLSPSSGSTVGRYQVTVRGSNFTTGSQVLIGGRAVTAFQFVRSSEVWVQAPAGTAGPATVEVRNPNGQSGSLINGFTYTSSSSATAAPTSALRVSDSATADSSSAQTLASETDAGERATAGDEDADGLPTQWETQFGLAADSATGNDGAEGDPDGDGVSNLEEYRQNGHPRGFVHRYLAEGAVSTDVATVLAVANAGPSDAALLVSFSDSTGRTSRVSVTVPAGSRRTIDAASVPALAETTFSTVLESDAVVAVDRFMFWRSGQRPSSVVSAVEEPATEWRFADDTTAGGQALLIQNPTGVPAELQIRYVSRRAGADTTKAYVVRPTSRATLFVDSEAAVAGNDAVAVTVASTNGTPIVVERASAREGNRDVAARGPRWLVALGETAIESRGGSLSVVNMGSTQAAFTLALVFEDGSETSAQLVVAGAGELAVGLEATFGTLAGRAFAVRVESADPGAQLVVRRSLGSDRLARRAPTAATRLP